ncbi:hypothetical protein THAOC_36825 [Thalassiosira oceanica]|uniref:Fe2OG dioxygenase domain-containing protein n=1 Tax=Thalassiosira oceanica TaxID=159749 RepID=K0R7G9_THAOC|nr:hypothetical protein THAOC_36825 [Thalassiosira oceanica]|eukprot:EJK44621.1 hypothetical protein THAOC_36825 [Thalassiosira oceanica]
MEIDFRELRRKERRAAKRGSSSGVKKTGVTGVTATGVGVTGVGAWDAQSKSTAGDGLGRAPPTPYETELPRNTLSDDAHLVSNGDLKTVYYAERFLKQALGRELLAWLQALPGGGDSNDPVATQNGTWTKMVHANRRVAMFDSAISRLPCILERLCRTLVSVGAFDPSRPPNHVLVNEYQPGQGIMPHTDGPAYDSATATISLGGSDVIFKLWPREYDDEEARRLTEPTLEVVLHGNGSLVVFTGDAYINHMHSIDEVLEETTSMGTKIARGYRVSLTFRHKK